MNKATWATQDLAVSKIADKITLIKHSVQPKNLSINLQKKKRNLYHTRKATAINQLNLISTILLFNPNKKQWYI